MTIPKGLAARAVLELSDGRNIHIEIRDGSMFVQFYAVYTVRGRGRWRKIEREIIPCSKLCCRHRRGCQEAGTAPQHVRQGKGP